MKDLSIIDAHAHLDQVSDLSTSLEDAKASGVAGIAAVGMDVESNRKTLDIARDQPGYIHAALGYHPWEIDEKEAERNLSFIRDHLEGCVAIGEIGLDYKVKVKKELQRKVLGKLLDMAMEHEKPVILHCRFSQSDTLKMVKERAIARAVFHWYSGPFDTLEEIISSGYFVSATPALRYSPVHQEAIRRTPLEFLLLETDAPVSYQGLEARPKDVRISLEEVSRLKGLSLEEVSEQTTRNICRFLGIPSPQGTQAR